MIGGREQFLDTSGYEITFKSDDLPIAKDQPFGSRKTVDLHGALGVYRMEQLMASVQHISLADKKAWFY